MNHIDFIKEQLKPHLREPEPNDTKYLTSEVKERMLSFLGKTEDEFRKTFVGYVIRTKTKTSIFTDNAVFNRVNLELDEEGKINKVYFI